MNTEDHIIDCLKDKSFPPMVLIDGEWGTGKTYFVENTLTERLNKEFSESKTLYLSLYGISSLDDFKDRIVSLCLKTNQNISGLGNSLSKVIDGTFQFNGEKGVGSIIGGVSGVIKHTVLSRLKNSILILDDLERVNNDGLIKNLLGEAFNLVGNNKNIKVIVVANASKLSCKEDIEKVFFDKISFVSSSNFVLKIVSDEFSDVLDGELIARLKEIVVSLNLTNIRILKRSLHKFKKIYLDVKDDERIVLDLASQSLLEQVIRFCCCSFESGTTEEMIVDSRNYSSEVHFNDVPRDDLKDKIHSMLGQVAYGFISEKLVSYCFSGVYDFEDVVTELQLPTKNATLELMISDNLYALSEQEFQKGIQLLLDYINTQEHLDFVQWFRCCDCYLRLADKRIIKCDERIKDDILKRCNSISVKSFMKTNGSHRKISSLSFKNELLVEAYNCKREELEDFFIKQEIDFIKTNFNQSWRSISNLVEEKWRTVSLLNLIGEKFIFDSLNRWEIYDLALFVPAMSYRYEMQNLDDFYLDEISTIDALITLIDNHIGSEMFGRRTALFIQIREKFENILQRMRKNMGDD